MKNPLQAHPPWRQLVIIAVVIPVMILLAVLAFAWPTARIAPRQLPVGIVGTSPANQQARQALAAAEPGGFDFHLYPDQPAAESGIRQRDIYGAFAVQPTSVTVLEASGASPTVAQLLNQLGQKLASDPAAPRGLQTVDVVPTSPNDPHGLVLSSAVLPLSICGMMVAAAIAVLIGFRPAWRQILALGVVSSVAGAGAYLVTEGFLGSLPGEHLATWAALALTILAISTPTAGLIALLGARGLGLGGVITVFIGNPFSGAGSAPQLLPNAVDHLGQWLPAGAGANLLRSTAYFHGNGAAGHLLVLILWTAAGLAAVVVGHHTSPRFAAHPSHHLKPAVAPHGRDSAGQVSQTMVSTVG